MSGPGPDRGGTESDPRPRVRLARTGLPGGMLAVVAIVAAALLFMLLDGRRRHRQAVPSPTGSAVDAFPAPPPLLLPAPPSPPAPVRTVTVVVPPLPAPPRPVVRAPPPPPPPATFAIAPFRQAPAPPNRSEAPALVLDALAGVGGPGPSAGAAGPAPQAAGDDAPVRATVIRDHTTIMPVGTVIAATLETPIDTARPGLVRAVVAQDARGFDGRRVLIPRGSRLIGEYQSDVRSTQNRVLVTWTRLIRPDGVAVRINSPAADTLGGAGVPGHLNTFFFRRFTAAVLQSALTVGVNLASRPGSGSVIVGLPSATTGSVGQDLFNTNDIRPKITVKRGASVEVFVARDLDFAGASLPPQGGGG